MFDTIRSTGQVDVTNEQELKQMAYESVLEILFLVLFLKWSLHREQLEALFNAFLHHGEVEDKYIVSRLAERVPAFSPDWNKEHDEHKVHLIMWLIQQKIVFIHVS